MIPANTVDMKVIGTPHAVQSFYAENFKMPVRPRTGTPKGLTFDVKENSNPVHRWLCNWNEQVNRKYQTGKGKLADLVFVVTRRQVLVYPKNAQLPFAFPSLRTAKDFFKKYKIEFC